AASCPPASRCMSARSRAAASVVSMMGRRVGGHRVLNLLVETKGKILHLGEVAAALLGRHGLADFVEVAQHVGLALGAKGGNLAQFLSRLGSNALGMFERRLEFLLLGGDYSAVLSAISSARMDRGRPVEYAS